MSRIPREIEMPALEMTAAPAEPIFLARIRLRARRHVRWLEQHWAGTPATLGLSISPDEVDRILSDGAELARAERTFYETDPSARMLTEAIADADAGAACDPRLERLRRALGLDDAEIDLLSLAVAVEADPWLRRVFGYIHDDATSLLATPWLARQLFGKDAAARSGPESRLIRWQLARPIAAQPNPWSTTAAWTADPGAVSFLLHGTALDPALGDAARLIEPPRRSGLNSGLYPRELETMVSFVRALDGSPDTTGAARSPSIEIVIAGQAGAGKRTLAAELCAALQRPLLIAHAGALGGPAIEPAAWRESVVRVVRSAWLCGAALYWHDLDTARTVMAGELPPPSLVLIGATGAAPDTAGDGVIRRTVRLPSLTQATRASLWSTLTPRPVPPQVLDWPLLPSDIVRAAAMAPAGPEAIAEACRATLRGDATSLARPLGRPYVWDDLVVSAAVRRHLGEFEAQARLRWPVYEGWGFGRLCPMGLGIAALFAGPSGTGKTMAAQVLARSLGMEMYRVDLAAVMSKYIGDTEKHLRQVFDACERANVLLFFDEADALFGQRMQVKDAHDRFANIEIDYLLQRMEQFDGVAVLATNRKTDIDEAFVRRIRFIIDFLPPGVAERRELWTRALPARAPNGDELLDAIDWDFLAQRLAMTGADIKGAAIGAAVLARAEGTRIGMTQVVRAARRELAKHGVLVRAGELET
jgi:hypothetical protein